MIFADWLVIALIIVFCIFGMLFGFGKGLKFFTGGIIGIIISVFVCYALGGFILKLGFVQKMLTSFCNTLDAKGNGFCRFLLLIRIDVIVYYVALFIIVSLARILIVKIIKSVVEVENMALIIINKAAGVILFVVVFFMLLLLVFWIISLINGGVDGSVYASLKDSKIGLDSLYASNPFLEIIKFIKIRIVKPA